MNATALYAGMITLTIGAVIGGRSAILQPIINQFHILARDRSPAFIVQPPKRGRRRLPTSWRGRNAERRSGTAESLPQTAQRSSRMVRRRDDQDRSEPVGHDVVSDEQRFFMRALSETGRDCDLRRRHALLDQFVVGAFDEIRIALLRTGPAAARVVISQHHERRAALIV